MTHLAVTDYAEAVALHDRFPLDPATLVAEQEQALTTELLDELQNELRGLGVQDAGQLDASAKRTLLDAAVTVLPPNALSRESVDRLDRLLQSELSRRELFEAAVLAESPSLEIDTTRIVLWQGDITTLDVDAIVNAANSQLLGCFLPQHKCIDNAIHGRAGVRMRSDCHTIMSRQGHPEATGQAKVTRAYNLPSNFVIHTVGPIVEGEVTAEHRSLLSSCYSSVLDTTEELEAIRSIAFCSISTGVFGYPIEHAAPLAIETVSDWLRLHPGQIDTVIFNVFSTRDREVYQSAIETFSWRK